MGRGQPGRGSVGLEGRARDADEPSEGLQQAERGSSSEGRVELVTHRLVLIARHLQTRILDRLAERGYDQLRPSLGRILIPLGRGPQPLGALARRLAISKQALSQLAAHAESGGYVLRCGGERHADPRQLELTDRGREVLAGSAAIVRETEVEYASHIGREAYAEFVQACWDLYLVGEAARGAVEDRRLVPGPSLVALLPFVAEVQARLIEGTERYGHRGLKLSYANVLPRIGPDGTRSSDLARSQGLSRQVMSQTCRELEARGFLRRERDPGDRRGAILLLTSGGRRLLEDSLRFGRELESEFEATLGSERFAALVASANALFAALRNEIDYAESFVALGHRARAIALPVTARERDGELAALAAKLRRQLGAEAATRLGMMLCRRWLVDEDRGSDPSQERGNE